MTNISKPGGNKGLFMPKSSGFSLKAQIKAYKAKEGEVKILQIGRVKSFPKFMKKLLAVQTMQMNFIKINQNNCASCADKKKERGTLYSRSFFFICAPITF